MRVVAVDGKAPRGARRPPVHLLAAFDPACEVVCSAGHGPAVMATLRNFAVSRHRLVADNNIAHAFRRTARHPNRALALLT